MQRGPAVQSGGLRTPFNSARPASGVSKYSSPSSLSLHLSCRMDARQEIADLRVRVSVSLLLLFVLSNLSCCPLRRPRSTSSPATPSPVHRRHSTNNSLQHLPLSSTAAPQKPSTSHARSCPSSRTSRTTSRPSQPATPNSRASCSRLPQPPTRPDARRSTSPRSSTACERSRMRTPSSRWSSAPSQRRLGKPAD